MWSENFSHGSVKRVTFWLCILDSLDGKQQTGVICLITGSPSIIYFGPVQFSSVAQLCLTLCKPMAYSMPGFPVYHQLPEFTQIHVY